MAEINWNLLQVPDIGGNALAAFERGQQIGRQRKAEQAYAAYATDPNENNLNALAQFDPKFVMGQKQQIAAAQMQAQEKQRADLLTMGKLLSHAKDPVTYAQARQAAQMYGIDISQAPEQYDPSWIGQTKMLVDAFNKDGGQSLTTLAQNVMMTLPPEQRDPNSPVFVEAFNKAFIAEQTKTIPYTQGGGVAGYNPYTGQTNTIIAPNPGDKPTGAPVGPAPKIAPPPQAIEDLRRNPGSAAQFDEIFGPGSAARILGGAASNGSGGFLVTPPQRLSSGVMTSGRRTPEGNRAVGGVPDSWHVDGNAVDYDGPDLGKLLSEARQKFPGAKAFIHDGHVHVQDRRLSVPYYGKNGTRGLK